MPRSNGDPNVRLDWRRDRSKVVVRQLKASQRAVDDSMSRAVKDFGPDALPDRDVLAIPWLHQNPEPSTIKA